MNKTMQIPLIDISALEDESYTSQVSVKVQPSFEQHIAESLPQVGFDTKADLLRWLLTSFFTGELISKATMLTLFNSRYKKLLDNHNYYKTKCNQMENGFAQNNQRTSINRETSGIVESERDSQESVSESEESVRETFRDSQESVRESVSESEESVRESESENEETFRETNGIPQQSIFEKFKLSVANRETPGIVESERDSQESESESVESVRETNRDSQESVRESESGNVKYNLQNYPQADLSYTPQAFHDLVQQRNTLERQNETFRTRNATLKEQLQNVTQQFETLQAKPFVQPGQHLISDSELQEILSLKAEHTALTNALTKGMPYITQNLKKHSDIELSPTELIRTIEYFKEAILAGENVDDFSA